jgi:two-component sensor histidine kinase
MKAGAMEGNEAQNALEDSQHRVRSIAMIHEQLSGTEHMDRINFAEYAGELVRELGGVYDVAGHRIALRVDAEPVEMGIHRAVPCALILNELVTNALRHAFRDRASGEVRVSLRQAAPEELELAVEDDGVGCAPVIGAGHGKSLGLRIVQILTRQLEGTLEQRECANGTRFVLRFGLGSGAE